MWGHPKVVARFNGFRSRHRQLLPSLHELHLYSLTLLTSYSCRPRFPQSLFTSLLIPISIMDFCHGWVSHSLLSEQTLLISHMTEQEVSLIYSS
ncbi:hypothetical protein BO86DRAFT_150928 [Aspergillus japonicus CBS 114.51]|uniref:Uncharacterized protein n=2 Tax=Aspergillus TaxID=5052 RepID=A0A2V5HJG7_ASPV1|nr:hypothetical protein BO86DRAFT_150928 [Aspergillus japonicus CBS 114.51]PYI24605.1 hypothetical protein BO99DRAFT_661 [Aspergillus violaceofuscus CBS 115571]RAH79590.1 hypothetical protein BO86DRAFT_150928 [Aspergillus japonicus CBS 114.51]